MNRLLATSLSLLLASALLGGCGSDSGAFSNSAFPGVDQSQIYRGLVLGRVKLIPALQEGPVEVLTMDGQLIHAAQAGRHGFFYYENGYLPPDFRLRARRGVNTYESEYRGGWHGGTLYINAGTTLASAYLRSHPGLTQAEAEAKIRRFLDFPEGFPMSWVSTVRTAGFDTPGFFQKVQNVGSLDSYLNTLIARIDSGIQAKEGSLIGDLLSKTANSIFSAAVNDVAGDTVARMGNDFTTAGALATIENDLVIVSSQITELNQEFEKAAAAVALKATLQPLQTDALQINDAVVNITDTIGAFIQTHPNDSDYNVPSSYPAIQSTIGQLNSLNLANLTNPILSAVSNTGSQGIYQLLVKEQMTEIAQTDTAFNHYPWRSNQLTTAQLQMMGSLITSLKQSAYLQAEYANLQTNNLAAAITQASNNMADISYQIQVAAQQVPDLFPTDEIISDPGNQVMWFSAFLGSASPQAAANLVANLEVGPYNDFGIPTQSDCDNLVRNRIGPATSPQIATVGSSTWDDVSFQTWQAAFTKMGIDPVGYAYEHNVVNLTDNEGCYYTSAAFSTSPNETDLNFYEWNGTGRNPSTSPSDPDRESGGNDGALTNVLAVRRMAGAPELAAGGYLPLPLTVGPHSGDTTADLDDHVASFVISAISPFQLPFTDGGPVVTAGNPVSANGASLGVQVSALAYIYPLGNSSPYSNGSDPTYDITQRVAWSSSDPSVASVSNFFSNTTTDNADFRAPGGCGFVTFHPPLDGSVPSSVVVSAKLFSYSTSTGSPQITITNITVPPPANCHPVLSGAYATPNNQIVDVSNGSTTIPITLLAFYQDGRVFDVSTDSGTTWTLKDSDGNVLNSLNSGGFGVASNTGKNVLFLSDPISTANVTYTGSFTNPWGTQSFSGSMGLIHTPKPVTINTILPAVGSSAGGQTIVIKGENFTNPSIVYFNGVPATSTFFVTSTQLSVVTPPNSVGAASVVVSTSNGNSSNAAFYNYTP